MPENDLNTLTGIAAVCTACGTFLFGIFSKSGIDKQVKDVGSRVGAVKEDLEKMEDKVLFKDTFEQFETSQTLQHKSLLDTQKDHGKMLIEILGRLPGP